MDSQLSVWKKNTKPVEQRELGHFITGHFITRQFITDILLHGHSITQTFYHMDILSHSHFITRTFYHKELLSHGQLVPGPFIIGPFITN